MKKKLTLTAKKKENTERKRATATEVKLQESEVRYRRLFETALDGILILDSQTGQIMDVNPFLEKLLGYTRAEFLNKKLWEVGAFKNTQATKNAFKILQKEGQLRYDDFPLESKSGKSIEVEFVSNSYMAGGALVIQCNIRDITERKKFESMKETARLLEEERWKMAFTADATHELRTPVAIIKGNVDLAMLHESKNPKSAKSALRAINYEIKHLSSILSDLTLITSQQGEFQNKIVTNNVDLRALVGVVVERCKALAYKKKISITVKKMPHIVLTGDKVYLEKMLTNLIKNSIIYGRKNGNTRIETLHSKESVTLSVVDDGVGISKEDLPHIFERFYQADKSHHSEKNSVGLGLSIVKWVAESHGGNVSVENNTKGCTFSVTLPLKG